MTDDTITHEADRCEAGCKVFDGGERKHHRDCVHYPESLTKLWADKEAAYLAEIDRLSTPLTGPEVAAIRAEERERCAKIADALAEGAAKSSAAYRGGSNPWDRYRALAGTYGRVAQDIRALTDKETDHE